MKLPPEILAKALPLVSRASALGIDTIEIVDGLGLLLVQQQEAHEARVTELLAANNREVEARRKAEDERNMAVAANQTIWRVIAMIQEACEAQEAWAERLEQSLADAIRFKPTHRHWKGGFYQRLFEALHSETDEVMTVYRNAEGEYFARPKALFEARIDGQPRFLQLKPDEQSAALNEVLGTFDEVFCFPREPAPLFPAGPEPILPREDGA